MKQTALKFSVEQSAEKIKSLLLEKGFTVFIDIDHQANAKSVDLEMPASRMLIFGNPTAGTKLMQKDILASIDLPLRLAIVEKDNQTLLIHQTKEDYLQHYSLENHLVLDKMESLFDSLATELS